VKSQDEGRKDAHSGSAGLPPVPVSGLGRASSAASARASRTTFHEPWHITALPSTSAGEDFWAPFAFPRALTPGHAVALREDMGEVARSLGKQVLGWRVRWMFGDRAMAAGVAASHAYRKAGVYKISVQSYYAGARSAKGWYTFDLIDVIVGPLPASAPWLRPASPTPTPAP